MQYLGMRHLGSLLLFLILVTALHSCMNSFASTAYNNLEITGKFTQPGTIKLYYTSHLHGYSEGKFIKQTYKANKSQQAIKLQLNNKSISAFKLQFNSNSPELIIKQITLNGFFQKQPLTWNAKQIEKNFLFNGNTQLVKKDRLLQITPISSTTVLNSKALPANGSFIISHILPIALALAFVLLITNIKWRSLPVIEDLLSNQNNRNKNNFRALDGLRGIAALLVLLEHTIPEFLGTGRAGVWLFFVLSGFLLSKPFVTTPQIVFNPQKLSLYMQRRVKRIIPMFYFMITIIFLMRGHIDKAARHYLFVQGDGHFWTILHEIYFYILLPFIALACYLVCRGKHFPSIIFLVVLSLLWAHYANLNIISIYGLSTHQIPNFQIFILGMIGGYIYFGLFQQSVFLQKGAQNLSVILGVTGLLILSAFIFFSAQLNIVKETFEIWLYPYSSGLICLTLILLSTIGNDKSIYNRFLSLSAIRFIGIIGYSFYLLHPYTIGITKTAISHLLAIPVNAIPTVITAVSAVILTTLFASFTYSYIERPFLKARYK